jgi:4-amino-4-deoxy-L-arabinose transferase-like glycosyltransferase
MTSSTKAAGDFLRVLERHAFPIALCFIALACLRIADTYRQLSVTTDEPFYLTRGLELLAAQPLEETAHPPLAQWAVALVPFSMGARVDPRQGVRPLFLPRSGKAEPWRIVAGMRAGVLPFFVWAALIVFWAARRYFGAAAAVVSTALFTLLPPVLAHAGLATTDMPLAATVSAAFFLLVRWAEAPRPRRAVLLGIAAALAVLSKFSALLFLPAAAALALIITVAVRRPRRAGLIRAACSRIPGLLLAAGVGALAVWAAYGFTVGTVPAWFGRLRVPAPGLWEAIRAVALHNAAGHAAFLLGQQRMTGWWYYFPVALAVKTPLALLLLAGAGLVPAWRLRRAGGLFPLALFLGVLIPAMTARIDIGVRYILPIYTSLSILGGVGAVALAGSRRIRAGVPVLAPLVLIAWMAVSGARSHPNYLAYFNESAGRRPDRIVVDSDLDWRQDLVLVGRRLRQYRAGAITLDLDPWAFPNADIYESLYGLPPVLPEAATPAPGWHVIGLTPLHLAAHGDAWYERLPPVERVGGTLIFRVP